MRVFLQDPVSPIQSFVVIRMRLQENIRSEFNRRKEFRAGDIHEIKQTVNPVLFLQVSSDLSYFWLRARHEEFIEVMHGGSDRAINRDILVAVFADLDGFFDVRRTNDLLEPFFADGRGQLCQDTVQQCFVDVKNIGIKRLFARLSKPIFLTGGVKFFGLSDHLGIGLFHLRGNVNLLAINGNDPHAVFPTFFIDSHGHGRQLDDRPVGSLHPANDIFADTAVEIIAVVKDPDAGFSVFGLFGEADVP